MHEDTDSSSGFSATLEMNKVAEAQSASSPAPTPTTNTTSLEDANPSQYSSPRGFFDHFQSP